MHIDARQLDNNSLIEGDICIIGAGAAGISMAMEWINSPYKIILLEGGGFEYDDKVQELYNGKIVGHPYFPMKSSRLHYFGGTTGHWGGMCSPFDEIDFEKRDWVEHSGWPITLQHLVPYYSRANPLLEIGPNEWDLSYWQKVYPSYVPLPLDNNVIWNKMWQFSPPTRFGKKYKDNIVNAKNIHLYTYANVVDIGANENVNTVTEVTIKNYAGKQHTVKAKHFVLACCTIQNARLLLASNKQATAGLGNDNDLVGRYFMEHIEIQTGELWLNDYYEFDLYKNHGKIARAEFSVSAIKQKEEKILNATVSVTPILEGKKTKPLINVWTEKDPRKSQLQWEKYYNGTFYKKRTIKERLFPTKSFNSWEFYTRAEQAPNPLSRVVLSKEKDALGVPYADLNWQMVPIDKKTIRRLNELIGQQVGAAGVGRVKVADFLYDEGDDLPSYTSGGWHQMGTTRMSDNPQNGVVDANCKVHGINNLFVAGAACFTTGSSVNPTLTVIAISLRLSDHLKEVIKS